MHFVNVKYLFEYKLPLTFEDYGPATRILTTQPGQQYDTGHGDRLMAANIEEKVIEKLRALPEDQQAEVLKFVEDLAGLETNADNGLAAGRVAIWDKIEEIMRDVPDEVLANIPTDGSINVDHYLYGASKKQP